LGPQRLGGIKGFVENAAVAAEELTEKAYIDLNDLGF